MLLPHYEIQLSAAEQQELEALRRAGKTPQQTVRRATILLLAQAGLSNQAIADQVGTSRNLVQKWRKRFALYEPPPLVAQEERVPVVRLAALQDLPRSPSGFFPRWRGTRSSPSRAKGLRSESVAAFPTTACGTWPGWWPGAGKF
jgi:hypothetical protein